MRNGQGSAIAFVNIWTDAAVEGNANAALITAAPDLYDALRKTLPIVETVQRLFVLEAKSRGLIPDDTLIREISDAISDAIAKAEGRK